MPDNRPKLELGDGLMNILGPETKEISDERFVNNKERKDEVLESIKEEYNFDEIKDAFDDLKMTSPA